jgi:hypothetical protein
LHRDGDAESFRDDYVLFAMPARGKNDEGAVEKLRTFLRICAAHKPVNMGNGDLAAYRLPEGHATGAGGKGGLTPDFERVIAGVSKPGATTAVFDSRENAEAALREVIQADLGLSVNLSTSLEGARECCRKTGIKRHSVEYSLGFWDRHNRLPSGQVLELSTMCGHGMVSSNLAKKMIDEVKENSRTPEEASRYLACFCPCGIYNPSRARRLLEEARTRQR